MHSGAINVLDAEEADVADAQGAPERLGHPLHPLDAEVADVTDAQGAPRSA